MLRLLMCFAVLKFAHCFCPDGYVLQLDGECIGAYQRVVLSYNTALDEAISKCQEDEAQPVIIHNKAENDYWHAKENGVYIVLGLMCNTETMKWQWSDYSLVDYKPPSYSSDLDKNCVTGCLWYIWGDAWTKICGTFTDTFDLYCTKRIPIVEVEGCENFANDSDDGTCYQIGATAETWQDAQLICKQFGANLASVHNSNENSFIRRLAVSKGAIHGVFLGATISGKGGNFGWIDGSKWDYDNFFPGFPMPGLGDCIALDTSTTAGQWMNMACTAKLPVVCVRDRASLSDPSITCSGGPFEEDTLIASPGFPYDASVPCEYFLTVDDGKKVEVEIAYLEANSCCDFLTIYDGYFGGFILANLTGEIRDTTFTTSDSNVMRVSWQPKGGVNVRGFTMSYRGV